MTTLAATFLTIQQNLFPALEAELKQPLSKPLELFVSVAELADPARHVAHHEWRHRGPSQPLAFADGLGVDCQSGAGSAHHPRTAGAAALRPHVAAAVRLGTTRRPALGIHLLARVRALCPRRSAPAHSRSADPDPLRGKTGGPRQPQQHGDRAARKPPRPKFRRGRPRKEEQRPPRRSRRLALQPSRTLAENLADLPAVCDSGCKTGAKGQPMYWRGYKLHLDVVDGEIPVSAILTSASTHDSQAAIALAQMTARRVTHLYDVMDSAYDAAAIRDFSRALGHVPLIDPNRRAGAGPALSPAQIIRYRERAAVERVNGELKDNHGGKHVRVRGAVKVLAHLMWGVIVVTVKGLRRLLE